MRFQRVRLLGRGAFGQVWLAKEIPSGREVAVKDLLNPTPEHVVLFQREARNLWRQAKNQYVVKLLGWSRPSEPPYLVLEYCPGGSLRSWVRARRPWRQIAMALGQACRGLHSLHLLGGFHRDIKPDNILIGKSRDLRRNIAKISDLGLARVPWPGGSNVTCTPRGTKAYMSPEAKAGANFSWESDIWSMGVTAWELLTGSRARKKLNSIRAPRSFLDLVQLMLSRDPDNRPPADSVIQEVLEILRTEA